MAVGNKFVTVNSDTRMVEAHEQQCRATPISRRALAHG
jgi:hypothetical protein